MKMVYSIIFLLSIASSVFAELELTSSCEEFIYDSDIIEDDVKEWRGTIYIPDFLNVDNVQSKDLTIILKFDDNPSKVVASKGEVTEGAHSEENREYRYLIKIENFEEFLSDSRDIDITVSFDNDIPLVVDVRFSDVHVSHACNE